MFTRFLRATLLLGVIFAGFCEPAVAGCQKDCNSSCYKERWGAKYDDPVCRSACKARNKACKVGIPKPDIPGEPDPSVLPPDPREDIDNACAAPFETLTGYVRTQCGDYEGRMGDRRVIQDAREILIASRIFKPSEFDGVTIRWCPLDGAEGMSPAPGIVYLDSSMEGAHVLDIASLLAHEMQHERQWRRHKKSFPCKYSEAYLACGGCQDEGNRLEKEAYLLAEKFDRVADQLATRCETNYGICPLHDDRYVGELCECSARGQRPDGGRAIP